MDLLIIRPIAKSARFKKPRYDDAKANIKAAKAAGAEICVSVDCKRLSEIRNGHWKKKFDKIVFQFPHTGSGEKDVEKNILEQQELLRSFFREAALCLNSANNQSQIHVTLKTGEPYSSWKVGPCCTQGTEGKLQVKTAYQFNPDCYQGYAHRRTIGFKVGVFKVHPVTGFFLNPNGMLRFKNREKNARTTFLPRTTRRSRRRRRTFSGGTGS